MAEAGAPVAVPEQRLHPWSWLFLMIAQLRNVALGVLALLFFGGGSDGYWQWELWGGLAAALLALASMVQYFTYRYGVIGADLVIRSGLFQRTTRSIPLARIRNVSLHRTVLHRLFGVAEVRLESAGGTSAEAHMRVLSMAAATELERVLEQGGEADAAATDSVDQGDRLLALDTAEVVRLGMISNRGMVVVAAGFGALWQLAPGGAGDWMSALGNWLFGRASALELGMLVTAAAVLLLVLALVVALRLLSVALALLQFHGFTLRLARGTLAVESGLLTRVRAHAPLAKLQFWTVTETLLHRLFRRQGVTVETAESVAEEKQSSRTLSHLVPLATPETVERLLAILLPQARYPHFTWQPLHPRAWRRMAFWPVLATLAAAVALAVLGMVPGWPGTAPAPVLLALVLLLVPVWIWRARGLARRCGFALEAEVVAWRSGWLNRRVSFAEVAKLQGVQLLRSPFDRRRGMATVVVDTAGAGTLSHHIHIRHLPEDVARTLANDLAARIARSPLAW